MSYVPITEKPTNCSDKPPGDKISNNDSSRIKMTSYLARKGHAWKMQGVF